MEELLQGKLKRKKNGVSFVKFTFGLFIPSR